MMFYRLESLMIVGAYLVVLRFELVESFFFGYSLRTGKTRKFSQLFTTCEDESHVQPRSNTFLVDILQPVLLLELSNQNLVKIVNSDASDEQCNQLCWKCLGYRFNPATGGYDNTAVFPKWRERFPEPPDLIGVKRVYDPIVDKPVRDASVALMRSIPPSFKGGVRSLVADGFQLYKLAELTPNKTRRAQMVNWLLYYRENLHGKSIEDLRNQTTENKKLIRENSSTLPSSANYERFRVD